jgi:radical SAM protein with 4Fe4S-binding SPASM domain
VELAPPGLYPYRYETPDSRLWLQLRVHADRSGLLFINGTQTLHLAPTEAELVKLTLDQTPRPAALAALQHAYPRVPREELTAHLHRLAALVARVQDPTGDRCVCDLLGPQPAPFAVRATAPYKADLALDYACNNRCAHCYNDPARRNLPAMPTAEWRRILDKLRAIGVPYVIFTGGEPTLRADLPELVAHAHALGQITGLNTNGRLLRDPARATALREAGLDHVQVTLNAPEPATHDRLSGACAWEETVAGLRAAHTAGLHVLTNTTLLRDNLSSALEMVEFLHALGVRTCAMNGLIHSGCGARHPGALTPEELAPRLVQVRDRAAELGLRFLWYTPTPYCELSPLELGLGPRCCNAAEYSVCVEPDGSVLPCQSYYVAAGNLRTDPWERIWESDLFRSFRDRREQPQAAGLPERCWDCEDLMLCGGGCHLERERAAAPSGQENVAVCPR